MVPAPGRFAQKKTTTRTTEQRKQLEFVACHTPENNVVSSYIIVNPEYCRKLRL